ncbi:DUF3768 domain-containing protein [Aestuariivirga sp.]|uniref:DUF3768 domain-containing protein n=1 Tax=Aestuariivirga sp. TaxID=2650926 RepID=UPI003BA916F0
MTDSDRIAMPETELEPSKKAEQERRAKIRELNDHLRLHAHGGVWRVTAGIASLPPATTRQVLKAVASFSDFNADNDPWDEHDCAVMEVAGERIIWKIDCYDRTQTLLSPDPANPKVTLRVLTVMLGHEY